MKSMLSPNLVMNSWFSTKFVTNVLLLAISSTASETEFPAESETIKRSFSNVKLTLVVLIDDQSTGC